MKTRTFARLCPLLALLVIIVGCQPSEQTAQVQQMSKISVLVEKATAPPPVHRFRKPVRDAHNRVLRQLAAECDRMIADMGSSRATATALTGSPQQQESGTKASVANERLLDALSRLSTAASAGNVSDIRASHADVVAAANRVQVERSDQDQ